MDKDLKKLLDEAKRQHFTVKRTADGHYMVLKNGRRVTNFAGTSSDRNAMRQGITHMRRAGFKWPPPKR